MADEPPFISADERAEAWIRALRWGTPEQLAARGIGPPSISEDRGSGGGPPLGGSAPARPTWAKGWKRWVERNVIDDMPLEMDDERMRWAHAPFPGSLYQRCDDLRCPVAYAYEGTPHYHFLGSDDHPAWDE